METKTLVARTWDDLVFTNRNTDYGAYKIRKAYSKRLMISFGVSTAMFAALFLLLQLSHNKQLDGILPSITKQGTLRLLPPPVFDAKPLIQPIVRPPQATPATRTNTTIRVVTTPVEPKPLEAHVSDIVPVTDGEYTGNEMPVGDEVGQGNIPAVATPVPQVLTNAEVMPAYEGGYEEMMRYLKSKFRYPASARRLGIEGTVYVSFVVNGDGTVSGVSVLRGISADCDKEAMRVIAMLPGWNGGKQNGNPVAVRMVLPVKFSLAK